MKLNIPQRFRFSEIRKDEWLASTGKLSKEEIVCLKKRNFVFIIYRLVRFLLLIPVSVVRVTANIIRVLNEFERLHFAPLRKIHRGSGCVTDRQTWLANGQNIYLGDFVKISAYSSIIAGIESKVTIGTNTIIAPGVTIVSFNHDYKLNGIPIRYQGWNDTKDSSIVIGEDVWLGANVVVLPGSIIVMVVLLLQGWLLGARFPSERLCIT